MKAGINAIQDELIEEFSMFDDWMERYEYIIDMGKSTPAIAAEYKDEDHEVKGCQSKVWLHASPDGDRVNFTADSDAVITKGIIGLLIRVLSGQKASEITQADLYFIDQIGLREHLSPNRSNGLASMVKQMKMYAFVFDDQLNSKNA